MSDAQQFEPRRAEANQEFTTTKADGTELKVKADGEGVVQPTSAAEVRLLDSFDLPVARKVLREQRRAAAEAGADQQDSAPSEIGPEAGKE